jgi:hypothetical protein
VEISDPYRWLEDQNSPETRAWIRTLTHVFGQIDGCDLLLPAVPCIPIDDPAGLLLPRPEPLPERSL